MAVLNVPITNTINQFREKFNSLATNVGDLSLLETNEKNSTVGAINELHNTLSEKIAVSTTDSSSTHYLCLLDVTSGDHLDSYVDTGITYTPSSNALTLSGQMNAQDFNSTSDERKKGNIRVIDDSVEKLSLVNGVSFEWKHSGDKSLGVIAQNVEGVFPELVSQDKHGVMSVNYNGLVGVLVESVKQLNDEIKELKNEISEMKR